jgi:hypothetical protein
MCNLYSIKLVVSEERFFDVLLGSYVKLSRDHQDNQLPQTFVFFLLFQAIVYFI